MTQRPFDFGKECRRGYSPSITTYTSNQAYVSRPMILYWMVRRKFMFGLVSLEDASRKDITPGGIADILSQSDLSPYHGLSVVKSAIERLAIPYAYIECSGYPKG